MGIEYLWSIDYEHPNGGINNQGVWASTQENAITGLKAALDMIGITPVKIETPVRGQKREAEPF